MALITCTDCQREVSDRALACPGCGAPISGAAAIPVRMDRPAKSRGAYVLLALLFGWIGVHNFYAGQLLSGSVKFGLLVLAFLVDAVTGFYSAFSLVLAVVFWVWAIGEAMVRTADGAGTAMA